MRGVCLSSRQRRTCRKPVVQTSQISKASIGRMKTSPAMRLNGPIGRLNLAGDLKGQVKGTLGHRAADFRGKLGLDAMDEVLQFQLERLLFFDWHRFAHHFSARQIR